MAPGGVPAPPEARGIEPPFFFFFFLDLLSRWEEGFPSGPWLPWRGRGESPSEIGSISLFLRSQILPLHRFLNIWRFVTPIGVNLSPRSFSQNYILVPEEERQPLYGWTTRVRGTPGVVGRAPLPRDHLGHRLALILLPKNHKYSKIILRPFLSRLDSV